MPRRLEGKVVAITGGGRGMGRAVALRMAEQGARIVIADYGGPVDTIGTGSTAPADEVVDKIRKMGGQAVALYENVATISGGERVTRTAVERFGRLDGLVCCAGINGPRKPLWELSEEEWDSVVDVHLKGHFCCARAAIPQMIKQGSGRLIFFSSTGAIAAGVGGGPPAGPGPYGAAKAGILGLMWGCASLKQHGITCNAIFPGAATRMGAGGRDAAGNPLSPEALVGTPGDPAHVAPIIIYLVSDEGARINGQIFGAIGFRVALYEPIKLGKLMLTERPGWDGHLDELYERLPKEIGSELDYVPAPFPPRVVR